MKNYTLILVALTAFNYATAQCPVNINFSTQSEIDNFQANYPECTEIPGNVMICDNFSGDIKNLIGLRMIRSIGGNLTIGRETMMPGVWCGNSELTSFDGLEALESVGGDFGIIQNEMLVNLSGLYNLKSIGGDLTIHHNKSLTSLEGMNSLDASTIYNLSIYSNSSLSDCEIRLICQATEYPGGEINIQNNADGCNSLNEAISTCSFGVDDPLLSGHMFVLTPNPVTGIVVVHTPNHVQYSPVLEIYGLDGRLVIQRQITGAETIIDLSGLSKGFYLVRMSGMKQVQTEKIVRQ